MTLWKLEATDTERESTVQYECMYVGRGQADCLRGKTLDLTVRRDCISVLSGYRRDVSVFCLLSPESVSQSINQ